MYKIYVGKFQENMAHFFAKNGVSVNVTAKCGLVGIRLKKEDGVSTTPKTPFKILEIEWPYVVARHHDA